MKGRKPIVALKVLDFIREHSAEYGFPPTCADIAENFGFKSPNSATLHLKTLERLGLIVRVPKIARGIFVV